MDFLTESFLADVAEVRLHVGVGEKVAVEMPCISSLVVT